MRKYNELEKQIIMLRSDLLNNSLNIEEQKLLNELNFYKPIIIEQLNSNSMNNDLKDKIINLLGQGMKLSVELEKLAQRGIDIIFPSNTQISNQPISYFTRFPEVLFMAGNESILADENIKVVTSYSDFKKTDNNVILITDRKFDTLIRYADISNRLANGTLLLLADLYKTKSNTKSNINSKEEKDQTKKSVSSKKVFISGSRSQVDIPKNVQNSLELIKKQNIKVLIGDSDKGVDKEIIDYLRIKPKYKSVEIFTIKKKPRVKVEEEWETRIINASSTLKPQEKQMVKDRAMADEADWGLTIFKPITKNRYGAIQVSSGTLRNSIQLLLNKKPVKFFYVYENEVKVENLRKISDLKSLIEKYRKESLTVSEKEEIKSSKGVEFNSNPEFVKYNKISKKYEELLIKELKIKEDNIEYKKSEQISLFK